MARPEHSRSDSTSPGRGTGDSRRGGPPANGGFRTRRERRAAEAGTTGQLPPVDPSAVPGAAGGLPPSRPPAPDPPASALPSRPLRQGVTVSRPPDGLVRRPVIPEPFARTDPAGRAPATPAPTNPVAPSSRDRVEATGPLTAPAVPVAPATPGTGEQPGPAGPDRHAEQVPAASVPPRDASGGEPEPVPGWAGRGGNATSSLAAAATAAPVRGSGTAAPGSRSLGQRLLRDAREVLGTVAVALGIAIVIKTFLVQPFFIPSQSMESTLEVNDRVLVSKLEPGPLELNRGDVVVFVDPGGWLPPPTNEPSLLSSALTFVGLLPANSGEHLIKRVIGLPGDTVRCCDPDGRVLVNNQPLDEELYLFEGDSPSTLEFEVTVPPGRIWVMGDHRSVSEDSRYHGDGDDLSAGAVPIDNVVGRAVLVMWPLSRWDWLGEPDGVFDGVGGQYDGVR